MSLLRKSLRPVIALFFIGSLSVTAYSQITPEELHKIGVAASPDRLETDIQMLADFGTRHTLSDTVSNTRGIGAARRWIKAEFEKIRL